MSYQCLRFPLTVWQANAPNTLVMCLWPLGAVLCWRLQVICEMLPLPFPNIWSSWRQSCSWGSNPHGCFGRNCGKSLFFGGYVLCSLSMQVVCSSLWVVHRWTEDCGVLCKRVFGCVPRPCEHFEACLREVRGRIPLNDGRHLCTGRVSFYLI
jgi:hypothetical protein